MNYKCTTFIPNILFDEYLSHVSESELKVLLVVIRQTLGWYNKVTKKRKYRDRISHSQFREKTGLSSRSITRAIDRLVIRKLIEVTDFRGRVVLLPGERKGKTCLQYRCLM
jgi:predicted HTH transcriptional regulator